MYCSTASSLLGPANLRRLRITSFRRFRSFTTYARPCTSRAWLLQQCMVVGAGAGRRQQKNTQTSISMDKFAERTKFVIYPPAGSSSPRRFLQSVSQSPPCPSTSSKLCIFQHYETTMKRSYRYHRRLGRLGESQVARSCDVEITKMFPLCFCARPPPEDS
jgi:hypothetical protein